MQETYKLYRKSVSPPLLGNRQENVEKEMRTFQTQYTDNRGNSTFFPLKFPNRIGSSLPRGTNCLEVPTDRAKAHNSTFPRTTQHWHYWLELRKGAWRVLLYGQQVSCSVPGRSPLPQRCIFSGVSSTHHRRSTNPPCRAMADFTLLENCTASSSFCNRE